MTILRPSSYTLWTTDIAKDVNKYRAEKLFYDKDHSRQNVKIAENIEKSSAINEQGFADITDSIKAQNALLRAQQSERLRVIEEEGEKSRQTTKDSAVFVATATVKSAERIMVELEGIGYKIAQTNEELKKIHTDIKIGNEILKYVGGQMDEVIRLTTIPNEVKALELADQARVNFSLGKNDRALKITTEAMELCSTSIPVIGYHIIALVSQDKGNLTDDVISAVKDFSNLIAFKLDDAGFETKRVYADILALIYPVLSTLARKYGMMISDSVRSIYKSISNDSKLFSHFISLSLDDDECAKMVNIPTFLREFHWKVLLDAAQDKKYWVSDLEHQSVINKLLLRIDESESSMTGVYLLIGGKYLNNKGLFQKYLKSEISILWDDSNNSVRYEDEMQVSVRKTLALLVKLQPEGFYQHEDETKCLIAEYLEKSDDQASQQIIDEIKELKPSFDRDIAFILRKGETIVEKIATGEKNSVNILRKETTKEFEKLKKYIKEHSDKYITKEIDEKIKKIEGEIRRHKKKVDKYLKKRRYEIDDELAGKIGWVVASGVIIWAIIDVVSSWWPGEGYWMIWKIIVSIFGVIMGGIFGALLGAAAGIVTYIVFKIFFGIMNTFYNRNSNKYDLASSNTSYAEAKIVELKKEKRQKLDLVRQKIIDAIITNERYIDDEYDNQFKGLLLQKKEFIELFNEKIARKYYPGIDDKYVRAYSSASNFINQHTKIGLSDEYLNEINKLKKKFRDLYPTDYTPDGMKKLLSRDNGNVLVVDSAELSLNDFKNDSKKGSAQVVEAVIHRIPDGINDNLKNKITNVSIRTVGFRGVHVIIDKYLKLRGYINENELAMLYYLKALSYVDDGNYKRAKDEIEEALKLDKSDAVIVGTYGDILYRIGEFEDAINYLTRAIGLKTRIYQNESYVGEYSAKLAIIFDKKCVFDKALIYYDKARESYYSIFGENYFEIATIYNNQASVYMEQGRYDKAISYFTSALNINLYLFDENHHAIASIYYNLGKVYRLKKEYRKASEYYFKALNINRILFGEDSKEVSLIYNGMGVLCENKKEYKEALKYYNRALSINKRNKQDVSINYINIGAVYNCVRKYDNAIKCYKKALRILQKNFNKNKGVISTVYNNLGASWREVNDYDKSIKYYNKALDIKLEIYDKNHPSVALVKDGIKKTILAQKNNKLLR